MSDENRPVRDGEAADERPRLPLWKKIAFVAALVLGLAGVALTRSADSQPDEPRSGTSGSVTRPDSFTGDDGPRRFGPDSAAAAEEEPSPWGPFFMKGGLSFAVAFAVGYALRTFLTLTIVVAGVFVLAIFGLQRAGIVGEIDWAVAEGYWDSLTDNLGRQFESFKTFVAGSVPSAGMGALGLITGFRR